MSSKPSTQSNQSNKPEQILAEQLSLAFGNYQRAIMSERVKAGLARNRKQGRHEHHRNTNHAD